jgi:hypothetical protein
MVTKNSQKIIFDIFSIPKKSPSKDGLLGTQGQLSQSIENVVNETGRVALTVNE